MRRLYALIAIIPLLGTTACFWQKKTESSAPAPASQETSAPPTAPASNGAGYGGGDNPVIAAARRALVLSLRYYQLGYDKASFGVYKDCSRILDFGVCYFLQNMSPAQRTIMRNLTDAVAAKVISQNASETRIPIELTLEPLFFGLPDGQKREVAGLTELKDLGKIQINTTNATLLSKPALAQLLAHENLHAVKINDKYMTDNDPFTGFAHEDGPTRLAFDTWAATTVAYLLDHQGKTPLFFPQPEDACYRDDVKDTLAAGPYYYHDPESSDLEQGTQKVTNPIGTALNAIETGDFSAVAWVSLDDDAAGTNHLIISSIDYTDVYIGGFEMYYKDNKFFAYAGNNVALDSGLTLSPNKYHMIAVTRTGGKLYSYVDDKIGASISSLYDDGSGDPPSDGTLKSFVDTYLGRQGYAPNGDIGEYDWKGRIAQFSLYTKALTAAQVKALYECGVPKTQP